MFATGFAAGVLFVPALLCLDLALTWVARRVVRWRLPWQ